jgi:GntR family transcriptional regulator
MGTPAEPGNERPMGADGSAGELAEPGRRGGPTTRSPGCPRLAEIPTIITNVTHVRNVRYICADQDMINIRYLASMPDDAINPYADEPLYVQLAGIVRRMIRSGKLQHLDPVPSESSLVQTYGVSRDTVRRTMALLRDEGVVFTVPHRGTYVGPRPN